MCIRDRYRYEQDEIVVFCKDIDKTSFMGLVRIVRESLDDLDVSVSTGFSWTDKPDIATVSYTHLDVYKRQGLFWTV